MVDLAPASASVTAPKHALFRPGVKARTPLTEVQERHQQEVIQRYCRKTAGSKQWTQKYRARLADVRSFVNFRMGIKELLYPLVKKTARGTQIEDIDGNRYLDITMDLGVKLFGHQPDFLQEAARQQLELGLELGTRCDKAGPLAELLCELTGHDRAVFLNTGTEAVMTALRLARTETGRNKVVIFEGAYHGHADVTLAKRDPLANDAAIPLAPGIPHTSISPNLIVLKYGEDQALEIIRQQGDQIAAVLVEPIQGRNPELRPHAFVKELRAITNQTGSALIFDEMITGFRLGARGAQDFYGVDADMCTYGKIVGGGFPIGVIGGSGRFLDRVDGGWWQFGDESAPPVQKTYTGGTFCLHPMAVASGLAVLGEIKRQGPALYDSLHANMDMLKAQINPFLQEQETGIRITSAGSLFRFAFEQSNVLFFYHLVLKGIFICEWRNCFLTTAHSKEDIDQLIEAVKETVYELQRGDFLKPTRKGLPN